MPLATGTKIGPYEIVSPLGVGGMGEVYRAHDSRLKRDVAIKVLPLAFASDPNRMKRFEREAQLLASLNHPNIASIYGLEESDNLRALIMELVEGSTLAERISQGPLPQSDSLSIAKQIAEALEYAHERGIIHRDLKPANIKLTTDSFAKVLDFGLAKALSDESTSADISTSPTLTAAGTRAGLILGTAAYMSPEQARGKSVDRRADIWSFGCVLFEMLTGKLTFSGETVSDTLAAVLTKEPELDQLPPSTPPVIHQLLARCLQKDPRNRLQAIGDARIEIEDILSGEKSGLLPITKDATVIATEGKSKPPRWRTYVPISTGLLLAIVSALLLWSNFSHRPDSPAWNADLISGPNLALGPRISPDGHTLAFQVMIDNVTQVAVGSPDTGNWTLLTHTRNHGFINELSWSPDGSKLYFDRNIATPVGIYSVPALGGEERLVLENAGTPEALPDGSLLIIRADAIGRWRIHHYFPDSQRLDPLPAWVSISTTIPIRVFPDGKEAVFNGSENAKDAAVHLYVIDIASGKTRLLAPGLPGRRNNESYPIAITPDGRAVLVEVPAGDLHRIVAVPRDAKGPIQTLMTLTRPPWYLDCAKDGTIYLDQADRPHEILRFPVAGGRPEVVASSDTYVPAGQYMEPVETSDGRFLLDTEFSGRGRLLIGKPGADYVPLLDTRDETSSPAVHLGNNLVAIVLGSGPESTIAIASATEGRLIRRLAGTKGLHITTIAASPDAKTLYFGSDGSIFSIPTDDGTPQKLIAGDDVTVDPNGREFIVTQDLLSVPHLVRVPLGDGKPEEFPLPEGQLIAPVPTGARALNRDGKMLITISPVDSWFFRVAVLDLATGHVTPIDVNYIGDTISGNWTADGRITSVGLPLKSHIWRFKRASN